MHTRTGWQELIAEVPRDSFIPDTVWADVDAGRPQSGFVALSKRDDPQRWAQLVGANKPVITQVEWLVCYAVRSIDATPRRSSEHHRDSSMLRPQTSADASRWPDDGRGHGVFASMGSGRGDRNQGSRKTGPVTRNYTGPRERW